MSNSGVKGSCYHAAAIVPISVSLLHNGRGGWGLAHYMTGPAAHRPSAGQREVDKYSGKLMTGWRDGWIEGYPKASACARP